MLSKCILRHLASLRSKTAKWKRKKKGEEEGVNVSQRNNLNKTICMYLNDIKRHTNRSQYVRGGNENGNENDDERDEDEGEEEEEVKHQK